MHDAHTSTPSTRRGRPRGRIEDIVRTNNLKAAQFAFVRAVIEGIDPCVATARYLGAADVDLRTAKATFRQLIEQISAQLDEIEAQRLRASIQQLDMDRPGRACAPSLEEFAAQFDADMYSERELQELYEVEHAGTSADALDRKRAVALLNQLQPKLTQAPKPDDPVSLWLNDRLCQQLRTLGVLTLKDCVTAINLYGRNWHRRVPGLGPHRAARLHRWLQEHAESITPVSSAPVPLFGPQEGIRHGDFRTTGANLLNADDDRETINQWASVLALKSSNTVSAYLKDVELLLMWAQRERGKSFSSLTVADAVAFCDFLAEPPQHWISLTPSRRSEAKWRPLRGARCASSVSRTLAAVNHLFKFLVGTHYLVGNPFAQVKPTQRKMKIDVSRSLTPRHIVMMRECVHSMPDDPTKRRLIAILSLLIGAGLRKHEAIKARWKDIEPMQVKGGNRTGHGLRILGKGGIERVVPLHDLVIQALEDHRQDRLALTAQGRLPRVPDEGEIPLISTLSSPINGQMAPDGALSMSRLHSVLKEFFRSMQAHDPDFERASAHWLRHTFAHDALAASGQDLRIVQGLLGHANLSTTGIYVEADMTDRIDTVSRMTFVGMLR